MTTAVLEREETSTELAPDEEGDEECGCRHFVDGNTTCCRIAKSACCCQQRRKVTLDEGA